MIFFKGTLRQVVANQPIKPGLVTTDFKVAHRWMARLATSSACMIEVDFDSKKIYDTNQLSKFAFRDRARQSHWVDNSKTRANILALVKYRILTQEEIDSKFVDLNCLPNAG